MTNLRILVKRNGSQRVEEHPEPWGLNLCSCPKVMCQLWHKQDLPIVHEPEPKKSLAQVLSGMKDLEWYSVGDSMKRSYEWQASMVMDYLEKEGWRKP